MLRKLIHTFFPTYIASRELAELSCPAGFLSLSLVPHARSGMVEMCCDDCMYRGKTASRQRIGHWDDAERLRLLLAERGQGWKNNYNRPARAVRVVVN